MERWLPILALIAVVSCGKRDYPEHYRDGKFRYQNPVDVEKSLASWQVKCEDPKNCPGAVGQITIRRANSEIDVCTGFLVSEDRVMTNSHCMPEPANLCGNNVTIHFPETTLPDGKTVKFKAEKFQCDQIIFQTQLGKNPMLQDYAFFKIKGKASRDKMKLDRVSGVKNDDQLLIVKVDPQPKPSEIKGILQVRKLKVVHKSFLTPASDSPFASIHALVGGQAVPGNSGSPIVSQDFLSVKLIAQSIIDKRTSRYPDIFEVLLKTGPNVLYATNITCVDGQPDRPNENCDDIAERTGYQLGAKQNDLIMKTDEDKEQLNKIIAQLPANKVFRTGYKMIKVAPTMNGKWIEVLNYQITPECFNPVDTWISGYKQGSSWADSAKISWDVVVLKKRVRVDDNGRLEVKIPEESITRSKVDLTFSPAQVKTKGGSSVSVDGKSEILAVCK